MHPALRTAAAAFVLAALLAPSAPRAAEPARTQGVDCGIFVSISGTDDAGCGGSAADPCRTIGNGITRAVASGLTCVFVRQGLYGEVVALQSGVHVAGGYDLNWELGPVSDPAHTVRITGGLDGATGQYLVVRAHDLALPTRISDVILDAPNASGTSSGNGLSSHGVHARSANLHLTRVTIEAGIGAAGDAGLAGLDAVTVPAQSFMNGGTGGAGSEFSTLCNTSSRGASGAAGVNSCTMGGTRMMTGGTGGQGGVMDSTCNGVGAGVGCGFGRRGGDAAYTAATFGLGGSGGLIHASCGENGAPGTVGLVTNGSAGTAGLGGAVTAGFWFGSAGGAGALGENGSGGGGGGGSAGCDDGTDAYGGGGGGGGSGGCRARGAGGGGGGGGASIGVFATASRITFDLCTIVRGNGGSGGPGGTGGRGQSGGSGGAGGAHPGSGIPGAGGKGAHGGHGGGGGGGAGGGAYGVIACSSTLTGAPTVSGGAAGSGGAGGVSAPTATGTGDDDGNDGPSGGAGTLGTTLVVAVGCTGTQPDAGSPSAPCDPATCSTVGVETEGAPRFLHLSRPSPNPARHGVTFELALPRAGEVRVEVYDPLGRVTRGLVRGHRPAGHHHFEWNGTTDAGSPAAAGVYQIRLSAMGRTLTQRVVLVR